MKFLLVFAIALALASPATAHDFLLGDFQIIHPSIPATAGKATTNPVYMVLANDGAEPERLLSIETPFGRAKFLRPLTAADGSVRMEELAWIDIPAGEVVLLDREGLRGHLSNVNRPLIEGSQLAATMVFQNRGRFDMFFMIDPMESVDEPTEPEASSAKPDPAADITAITAALRTALKMPEAVIAPIAMMGDVAIAGWSKHDTGALAFLRRRPTKGWTVIMWSNDSLLLPATLTSLGVPRATADALRSEMAARMVALGAAFTGRFTAFPGTAFLADAME